MKCPHCTVTIHIDLQSRPLTLAQDEDDRTIGWEAQYGICPSCKQAIIMLRNGPGIPASNGNFLINGAQARFLVWPQSSLRPCPTEVPPDVAADFKEASSVLHASPQASAALTRRGLQQVLRDYANTKSKDLVDQIQEVIDEGHIPAALADQLDAVRVIGNFAAHPLKSKNSGAILPVEPHEAEWNLDVMEAVFDHYFVKPAQALARKAALNKKLIEGGKQPLK